MRSVSFDGRRFQVAEDANGTVGEFLEFAMSDPDTSPERILVLLQPGARGYSVHETTGAVQAETEADVADALGVDELDHHPDLSDLWIVWRIGVGSGDRHALVDGADLRDIVSTAATLWAQRQV